MKKLKKSLIPVLSFIIALFALLFGFGMYYKSGNTSFIFMGLGLFSIIVGILILNGKGKLFIDNSELKFFNNEKAWKKAYKIWAILFFFIGILFIVNIFIDFYTGNIIRIAMILAVLVTLFYMFKYKK